MKKILPAIVMFIICLQLQAAPLTVTDSLSVAQAGDFADTFTNPAALPFRSSRNGNFMLSLTYGDEIHSGQYSEKLGFFQTSADAVTLSFGGRNAMFSVALGHDLDDRRLSDSGVLTYDMYFRMHFQLDLAYAFGPFSLAVRFQGGSSLVRSDRRVDSVIDFATNMLFSQFYENPGSEYFQLGAGLMWYDDWFTAGLYSDRVMSTSNGSVVFDFADLTDSLSLGLSFYLPRFTDEGELRLVKPVLTLQSGNMTGAESYMLYSFALVLQLLPDTDVRLEAGLISRRNADISWLDVLGRELLLSLDLVLGSWTLESGFRIPTSWLGGDAGRPMSFSLALRFSP